jgi:hypothetical protein
MVIRSIKKFERRKKMIKINKRNKVLNLPAMLVFVTLLIFSFSSCSIFSKSGNEIKDQTNLAKKYQEVFTDEELLDSASNGDFATIGEKLTPLLKETKSFIKTYPDGEYNEEWEGVYKDLSLVIELCKKPSEEIDELKISDSLQNLGNSFFALGDKLLE